MKKWLLLLLILLIGCKTSQDFLYNVDVTITPFPIQKNTETKFDFSILDEANNPTELELDHERYVHALSVREDLKEFKHLHHEDFNKLTEDNLKKSNFNILNTFEKSAKYYLVFEFKTRGKDLYKQMEIEVEGDREALVFEKDMSYLKSYGEYAVELIQVESLDTPDLVEKKQVKAGEKTNFIVRAIKNRNFISGFEDYLGTISHAVVWKEDLTNFMHAHAYPKEVSHAGEHIREIDYGNKIPLQVTFPEPGYYRLFVQFKHEGKIVTSDFTIQVN